MMHRQLKYFKFKHWTVFCHPPLCEALCDPADINNRSLLCYLCIFYSVLLLHVLHCNVSISSCVLLPDGLCVR